MLTAAGTVDGEITDLVEEFLFRHIRIVLSSLSLRLSSDRNVPINTAIFVKDMTAVWIGRISKFFAGFEWAQANGTPVGNETAVRL